MVDNACQPIIEIKAAKQMQLLHIMENNFEKVASLDQSSTFDGKVGTLPSREHLTIDPSTTPVVMPDRRVPIAVKAKLKTELDSMVDRGIVTPVTEPTPWISQLVVANEPNGKIRVCIDPKYLNKALQREHYTMPIPDDVLHELSSSKVFTKVVLQNGYWHVQLDEESSLLTTFQTRFGRFRFLRLPFGLKVSAEIFERKIRELFGDMSDVACMRNDIIIHGKTQKEHEDQLKIFMAKCDQFGVKLNREKLELAKDSITFVGHIISEKGMSTDPQKVEAITKLPSPASTKDVRRVLGMVQYLSRYIPNLTNIVQPLQNLLRKDVTFVWSVSQEKALRAMKQAIVQSPTLAIYDHQKRTFTRERYL